ncbi:molybdate ABC transporter substrate-binding protein [Candidatus Synechococcus calcipolaris G9]|uniref:Molybdate ABC transporter substrate-binding protein n=1 Tax=Candidatus Synechococcus calcipolaris G9 TaxID=1497997 RepID=A0ABT6EUC2_9SYNE|nr:molybdate ABC transporter substrate-binding protein [Candidatus Synechococcus calcipolaris]MDG2989477.1 molybdate ABC transporter substrate-binding protein [Candidatus Synechococcus calcipolaris G9]
MRFKQYIYWFLLPLITLVWIVGCTRTPPIASTELTVSSAIALTEPLEALKPIYQENHNPINITYNFGASGLLRQQIEQGADVDVFISASQKDMDDLANQNLLVSNTRANIVENRIVLVIPKKANSIRITGMEDLTKPEVNRVAIGNPATVPMGRYSEEIFKNLDLMDAVQSKLIFGENIRQVLSYVETGNVDAGLVWVTDANTTDQVTIVESISETLHSPAIYPAAVVAQTSHLESATAYVQFLRNEQAKKIFTEYGFIPIP